MTKHKKDFQTGDKFDLIERELHDLEKEKRIILTVTLEKEICMEALINKSNKLKDNVSKLFLK